MRALKITLAVAGLGLLLSAGQASAQASSTSTTFNVSASVAKNCTVSATNLAFGAYDPVAGTQVDGSSTLTIACTKNATASIALDDGGHPVRQMAGGTAGNADLLPYDLFKDAGRVSRWGGSGAELVTYSAGSRAPFTYTVYGRIPANRDVAPDSYSDSVTVTVNY